MKIDLHFSNIVDATIHERLASALGGTSKSEVTEINLAGNEISDLSWLAEYPNVKILNLSNTAVSDISVLQQPSIVQTLEELYLTSTEVQDISPIKHCVNLKRLSLFSLEIQDISSLEGMAIEQLDLSNTQVTDLTQVLSLQKLKKLSLLNVNIVTKDLLVLGRLQHLEELEVDREHYAMKQQILSSIKGGITEQMASSASSASSSSNSSSASSSSSSSTGKSLSLSSSLFRTPLSSATSSSGIAPAVQTQEDDDTVVFRFLASNPRILKIVVRNPQALTRASAAIRERYSAPLDQVSPKSPLIFTQSS